MNKLNLNHKAKWQAPPTTSRNGNAGDKIQSEMLPAESFERSENHSFKIGAGLLTAVALMGAAGCTPPPQTAAPEAAVEQTVEVDSAAQELGLTETNESVAKEPLTDLQIRERELELREREVALKEKELEILQKRDAEDAKLRKLQTQREAYEKGKRTGEAVGGVLDFLGAVGGEISDSLR